MGSGEGLEWVEARRGEGQQEDGGRGCWRAGREAGGGGPAGGRGEEQAEDGGRSVGERGEGVGRMAVRGRGREFGLSRGAYGLPGRDLGLPGTKGCGGEFDLAGILF